MILNTSGSPGVKVFHREAEVQGCFKEVPDRYSSVTGNHRHTVQLNAEAPLTLQYVLGQVSSRHGCPASVRKGD